MGFIYLIKKNIENSNIFKVGRLNTLENIDPKLEVILSFEDKNNLIKINNLLKYLKIDFNNYESKKNYFIDNQNLLQFCIMNYYKNKCVEKTNQLMLKKFTEEEYDDFLINKISELILNTDLNELINEFIKLKYFNDKMPQNKNVKFVENDIYIYNGKEWINNKKDFFIEVLNNLYIIVFYLTNKNILDDEYYEKGQNILSKIMNLFNL